MNQIPNIEEEKTRCSCGRLVASPFSETVCSSFPFCQEEVGTFPNDPTGLCREFAIKFHRGDFIKDGEDNSELISDWFHQQLQKAREEERERCIQIVEDYGKSMSKHHNQMIGTAHEDSKMMLAFDAHSRLIAVKHITEKMNHSELDQEVSK